MSWARMQTLATWADLHMSRGAAMACTTASGLHARNLFSEKNFVAIQSIHCWRKKLMPNQSSLPGRQGVLNVSRTTYSNLQLIPSVLTKPSGLLYIDFQAGPINRSILQLSNLAANKSNLAL